MSDKAYVSTLPTCDVCKQHDKVTDAVYDARTTHGPWAYLCEKHFRTMAVAARTGLGTGKGQRLIVGEPPERSHAQIRAEVMAAVEAGDFDAAEEAVGDRDLSEYL